MSDDKSNIIEFPKKKQETKEPDPADLGNKIQRIRESLDKINQLMAELKKQQEKRNAFKRRE